MVSSLTHLLFMDHIEKLDVKKDSTLLLALGLKEMNQRAFLLFEEGVHLGKALDVHDFHGRWGPTFYIDHFEVGEKRALPLEGECLVHLRLDPPFDARYLSYLWIFKAMEERGLIRILNRASGILAHNEKLYPLGTEGGIPSFVGTSPGGFLSFCRSLKERGYGEAVLKPLNLYQGLGVEKVSLSLEKEELETIFRTKARGPLMAQAFLEDIYRGEVRSIYMAQREVGTILKRPKPGDFLANVARGASFEEGKLTPVQRRLCEEAASDLGLDGVDWIAFDLIGDHLSEVNITCPGLLVETSCALGKNLGLTLAHSLL